MTKYLVLQNRTWHFVQVFLLVQVNLNGRKWFQLIDSIQFQIQKLNVRYWNIWWMQRQLAFHFFKWCEKFFLKLTFKVVFWDISQNVQITISRSSRQVDFGSIYGHIEPQNFRPEDGHFGLGWGQNQSQIKCIPILQRKESKQGLDQASPDDQTNHYLWYNYTVTAHITAFYLYIFILC